MRFIIKCANLKRQGLQARRAATNLHLEGRFGVSLALCFSDER
jgi:hypothetical protein